MSGGVESSRFTHLLQPIRDLSKNWNIDLAQELEEYLDELEHLPIAFDPTDNDAAVVGVAAGTRLATATAAASSARVMNFAEAALLIQGTSVIYSRKVEYLYALVFQTLAHLTRQPDATSSSQQRSDADANDNSNDSGFSDVNDVFRNPLPLVDALDEARNITLRTTNGSSTDAQRQRHAAKSNTNIQAAISLMGSLVPDERDHGETFKLLSCNLHSSGVLLLDEASTKYLVDGGGRSADEYDYAAYDRSFSAVASLEAPRRLGDGPVTALNFDDVADDFFMDNDDGHDDDHGAAAAAYGDVDYGYTDDTTDDTAEQQQGRVNTDGAMDDAAAADPVDRPLPHKRSHQQQEIDPWTPLDPFDASNALSRPFRKGRSFPKLKQLKKKKATVNEPDDAPTVDGLDDPLFHERFFATATRAQWSSWVWNDLDASKLEQTFAKRFCKAPLLATSASTLTLWTLERKWRALVKRRAASDAQSADAMLLQEQAEERDDAMVDRTTHDVLHSNQSTLDLDLNAPLLDENDDENEEEEDHGYDDDGGIAFDGSGANDWDAYDSNDVVRHELDPNRPLSYEDICRQHIATFMQGSEQYVRETHLTKQVNDWQATLAPILQAQDAHPAFDIHACGRNILTTLTHETTTTTAKRKRVDKDDSVKVPFGEIVGGMQQYEVCRMFLASLQLANSGNVQLVHGDSAIEQTRMPFQMTLLSTANAYESLQQNQVLEDEQLAQQDA